MKNKTSQINEEKIKEYILEFNRRSYSPEKGFKHISASLPIVNKETLDKKIIFDENNNVVLPQLIVDIALTYKSSEQSSNGLELVTQSIDNIPEGIYPYLIVSSAQTMKEALDLAEDGIQNMYVEDLFMTGYSAKVKLEKEIKKLFESKIRKYQKEVAFIMDQIKETSRYKLLAGIGQETYDKALQVLNNIKDAFFKTFKDPGAIKVKYRERFNKPDVIFDDIYTALRGDIKEEGLEQILNENGKTIYTSWDTVTHKLSAKFDVKDPKGQEELTREYLFRFEADPDLNEEFAIDYIKELTYRMVASVVKFRKMLEQNEGLPVDKLFTNIIGSFEDSPNKFLEEVNEEIQKIEKKDIDKERMEYLKEEEYDNFVVYNKFIRGHCLKLTRSELDEGFKRVGGELTQKEKEIIEEQYWQVLETYTSHIPPRIKVRVIDDMMKHTLKNNVENHCQVAEFCPLWPSPLAATRGVYIIFLAEFSGGISEYNFSHLCRRPKGDGRAISDDGSSFTIYHDLIALYDYDWLEKEPNSPTLTAIDWLSKSGLFYSGKHGIHTDLADPIINAERLLHKGYKSNIKSSGKDLMLISKEVDSLGNREGLASLQRKANETLVGSFYTDLSKIDFDKNKSLMQQQGKTIAEYVTTVGKTKEEQEFLLRGLANNVPAEYLTRAVQQGPETMKTIDDRLGKLHLQAVTRLLRKI